MEIKSGKTTIQEFANTILQNKLYRDDGLNKTISERGLKFLSSEYHRDIQYSMALIDNKPVALAMIVIPPFENQGGHLKSEQFELYSDRYFSVFTKEEYRGNGIARKLSVELATQFDKGMQKLGRRYDGFFVCSEQTVAPMFRESFSIAVMAGGFPPFRAVKRLNHILLNEPIPDAIATEIKLDSRDVIINELNRQKLTLSKPIIKIKNNTENELSFL